MKPHDKAWDLLNKMNGHEIADEEWAKASDYAKKDLKRKVDIVIDEVIGADLIIGEPTFVLTASYVNYWIEVRDFLNTL